MHGFDKKQINLGMNIFISKPGSSHIEKKH
jgi:hypothetical protein